MSRIFWIFFVTLVLGAEEPEPPQPTPVVPSQKELKQKAEDEELLKVLNKADKKRSSVFKERFQPIYENLTHQIQESPLNLYLDAVYQVFFKEDSSPEKAFADWKKKNSGLMTDPRLPVAADLSAAYLQAHILFLLGEEEKGIAKFTKILEQYKSNEPNLSEHHLLQESLKNTLLVKYYGIEEDYLKDKERYYGAVGEIENFFIQGILPWYEKNDPNKVERIWNMAIDGIAKASEVNETKQKKFEVTENARLLTLKGDSLLKIGNKEGAKQTYKSILVRYPEYPKYEEVKKKIIELMEVEGAR